MTTRYNGSTRLQEGGLLATHKQDFNAHVTAGDYRHKTADIDLSHPFSGANNLDESLYTIENSFNTASIALSTPAISPFTGLNLDTLLQEIELSFIANKIVVDPFISNFRAYRFFDQFEVQSVLNSIINTQEFVNPYAYFPLFSSTDGYNLNCGDGYAPIYFLYPTQHNVLSGLVSNYKVKYNEASPTYRKTLYNISDTFNVTILNQSSTSLGDNRFYIPGGQDLILKPKQSTDIVYDYIINKWVVCTHLANALTGKVKQKSDESDGNFSLSTAAASIYVPPIGETIHAVSHGELLPEGLGVPYRIVGVTSKYIEYDISFSETIAAFGSTTFTIGKIFLNNPKSNMNRVLCNFECFMAGTTSAVYTQTQGIVNAGYRISTGMMGTFLYAAGNVYKTDYSTPVTLAVKWSASLGDYDDGDDITARLDYSSSIKVSVTSQLADQAILDMRFRVTIPWV